MHAILFHVFTLLRQETTAFHASLCTACEQKVATVELNQLLVKFTHRFEQILVF